MLILANRK